MPETFNPRVLAAFELFAWISSLGAVLLAGSVLLGWATGSQVLKSGAPGLTAMSPLTAFGFILAGASLGSRKAGRPTAARACAVLLLMVCAAILASYIATGRDVLDPLIEHGLGLLRGGREGLTAPSTLAGFAVLAGALLTVDNPEWLGGWLLVAFAASGFVISGLALLGYAYGVEGLYATFFYRSMAVHTAAGLFVLFLACLLCEPTKGWASIIASGTPSGTATRRQLLLATALPVLIGLLAASGIKAGSIAPSLGLAMLVVATTVPLVLRILRDGSLLDAFDAQRAAASAAIQNLNQTLEEKVRERTEGLRLSEARFRSYFDYAPEGLVMFRVADDCRFVVDGFNGAFSAIYELHGRDITGFTPADWLDVEGAREVGSRLSACVASGEACRYTARRRIGAGMKTLDVILAPVMGAGQAGCQSIIGSVRDVSEAELREEQLRQSQKMEAVGQLTGGLAHDFNNLLTGISGSLELLGARIAQGRLQDADRYVTAAQGAARRAATLTHRLLAFSRRQTLDPHPVDVNRLIAGMEDLIRRAVGLGIELEIVGAAGLWPTLVDANQLENALLNLCINARDAMPDGGRITVETANKWLDERSGQERDLPPGQYLSVCVTDTGTGMTPDVIARAFDPFFTTKPLGEGTGLGLSMTYGFVRQSGGHVRIYSEQGQGTTVCLYLPRHHAQPDPSDREEPAIKVPRAEQGETVLIVDDEPTVRMLVSDVLGELGYIAIEAPDGPSGLRVLDSDARIDLLITDVGLPGNMNGRQMADAGRRGRPDLKVLFITGYAENAVFGNGRLEAGMHVLTKPFAMDALGTRIRDLITGPTVDG